MAAISVSSRNEKTSVPASAAEQLVSYLASAERAIGATWSAQANAWFAEAIPASRSPFPAVHMQARPKGGEPFSIGMWELVGLADRASQGREFR